MNRITDEDWSFENIRVVEEERATRLESVGPPDELVKILAQALDDAVDREEFCLAVDSRRNAFIERRAIVQFQIPRALRLVFQRSHRLSLPVLDRAERRPRVQ